MKRNPTVDDAVRGTNDDALLSKWYGLMHGFGTNTATPQSCNVCFCSMRLTNSNIYTSFSNSSAVNAGYIDDPFTKYFLKRAAFSTRRPPIINRGSYVRFQVIQSLISMFLDAHPSETCQIVSLGAGSDTRFFLMENQARSSSPSNGVKTVKKYFEIDFSEVTTKKAMVIKKNKPLSDLVGENAQIGNGGTELYGDKYVLVSGDFRTDFESSILPKLLQQGFDLSAPTLFLAEVVFVYLPPETSEALVKWVGDNVDQALFVVYEQLSGGEENGFTKVMVNNLGVSVVSFSICRTHRFDTKMTSLFNSNEV